MTKIKIRKNTELNGIPGLFKLRVFFLGSKRSTVILS